MKYNFLGYVLACDHLNLFYMVRVFRLITNLELKFDPIFKILPRTYV